MKTVVWVMKPGPMALVPVGATLLIIWAGATALQKPPRGSHAAATEMPVTNRWLASRWPVWLGTIAYSLYLWHWPLLIFWLAYSGHAQANLAEGAGVLLVSGVLAWLTTRYIEVPLRLLETRRLPDSSLVLHRYDALADR